MKLKAKGKALFSLSFSYLSTTPKPPSPTWAFLGFSPVSTTTSLDIKIKDKPSSNSEPNRNRKDSILEMFRLRQLQGSSQTKPIPSPASTKEKEVSSFKELGLSMEVIEAVGRMDVFVPSEIQCVGIPALLDGKSVVLSSHPRSGRTLAYLLPLIQLLRRNTKSKHPRAVVLCPTEELSDQVFHKAKFISYYAQQQSAMESDLPQKNSSDVPLGMIVGTPGEVLQHIEEGNVVPDEIKYLVLHEADTIFACGLGPEIQKIISPLKIHASKSNDQGFQTVLITSTIAKMLGEKLTPFMERLECNHAGQIAAMLLEMDKTEIFHLTESPDALKKKVAEAMDSFNIAESGS